MMTNVFRRSEMTLVLLLACWSGVFVTSCAKGGQTSKNVLEEPEVQLARMLSEGQVLDVAFSPDAKMLATGSFDKAVNLWDVDSGKNLSSLKGHGGGVNAVAFSSDGRLVASGSDDDSIKIWDVAAGKEIRSLKGHTNDVYSVTFSPDGKTLASSSCCEDKTVRLWDVDTAKQLLSIPAAGRIAFSRDGKALAVGSEDKTLKLWDLASGKGLKSFEGSGPVNSVVFSPDGRTIVVAGADKTVKLWAVDTGKLIESIDMPDSVRGLNFSSDGKRLAIGGMDMLKVWDLAARKESLNIPSHSGWIYAVAFRPDNKTLASVTWNKKIAVYDLATGKEVKDQ